MLAFNYKKMPLKKYKNVLSLSFLYIVLLKIECEIIMLGGINCDLILEKCAIN